MINRPVLAIAAALAAVSCSTADTARLSPPDAVGVYRIEVDGGAVYNATAFEYHLTQEADRLCPRGFVRTAEKAIAGKSGYGGRSYTIRCAE